MLFKPVNSRTLNNINKYYDLRGGEGNRGKTPGTTFERAYIYDWCDGLTRSGCRRFHK